MKLSTKAKVRLEHKVIFRSADPVAESESQIQKAPDEEAVVEQQDESGRSTGPEEVC